MQVSAELRWFWKGDCPDEVAGWFAGGGWACDPVRLQRSDEYFLRPGNTEIGCKLRGAKGGSSPCSELKAMITRFERNRIELWGKWDWHLPSHARSVMVRKDRRLRLCSASGSATGCHSEVPLDDRGRPRNASALPDDTCRIELTEVRVGGFAGRWWTLNLEAWGDLPTAPLVLARTLDMLDPPVSDGRLRNYPQFLDDLISSSHDGDDGAEIERDLIV